MKLTVVKSQPHIKDGEKPMQLSQNDDDCVELTPEEEEYYQDCMNGLYSAWEMLD